MAMFLLIIIIKLNNFHIHNGNNVQMQIISELTIITNHATSSYEDK